MTAPIAEDPSVKEPSSPRAIPVRARTPKRMRYWRAMAPLVQPSARRTPSWGLSLDTIRTVNRTVMRKDSPSAMAQAIMVMR